MEKGRGLLKEPVSFTVLVSSLGYFVDIYDLLLFGIVRVASLKGLGIPEADYLRVGIRLVNLQMSGMLLGGILWGILGDKRGRVSVLFGSIFIYSVANILNAFVSSVEVYGVLRFFAGVGLAGELGAAVTLVSESLAKERRGLGNTTVASVGILGAVFAGMIGDLFSWRVAYMIGGVMGLVLLMLRLSILDSGMYQKIKNQNVRRGDLRMLFYPWKRSLRYLRCILVGIPIWYVIGILVTFSPELSRSLHVNGPVTAGRSILFCYLGASFGNIGAGLLSQFLRSRRKVIFLFLLGILSCTGIFLFLPAQSPASFYFLCGVLGLATGYWVLFMTIAAEQFGVNLRATVTTTVPNFVRGSVVGLTFAFQGLQPALGLVSSAWTVGLACVTVAFLALYWIPETFEGDLNFLES